MSDLRHDRAVAFSPVGRAHEATFAMAHVPSSPFHDLMGRKYDAEGVRASPDHLSAHGWSTGIDSLEARGMASPYHSLTTMHAGSPSPVLQYGHAVHAGPVDEDDHHVNGEMSHADMSSLVNGVSSDPPTETPSHELVSGPVWHNGGSGQTSRPASAASHLVGPASPRLSDGRIPSVLDPARAAPSPPPGDLLHYHAEPPPWSGGYANHPPPNFQHAPAIPSSSSQSSQTREAFHLGPLPQLTMPSFGSQPSPAPPVQQQHQPMAEQERFEMWPTQSPAQSPQAVGIAAGYPSPGFPVGSMAGMMPTATSMPHGSPAGMFAVGQLNGALHSPSTTASSSVGPAKPVKAPKAKLSRQQSATSAEMMRTGSSGSGSGGVIVAPIINEDGSIQRRGSVRQQIACHSCRHRKSKCDGERPCRHCARRNTECTYEEVPRRRGPGRKKVAKLHPQPSDVAQHQAQAQAAQHAAATAAVMAASGGRHMPYPYAAPTGLTHPGAMQSPQATPPYLQPSLALSRSATPLPPHLVATDQLPSSPHSQHPSDGYSQAPDEGEYDHGELDLPHDQGEAVA